MGNDNLWLGQFVNLRTRLDVQRGGACSMKASSCPSPSSLGGPLLSQILTLYTTPVAYLRLDRLQRWLSPARRRTMPILASKIGADKIGATAD